MEPIENPFSPSAGASPPELAGREDVLEQTRILLGRIKQKRPEKSILLTGLRGVGKTVLLNEMERIAPATTPFSANSTSCISCRCHRGRGHYGRFWVQRV